MTEYAASATHTVGPKTRRRPPPPQIQAARERLTSQTGTKPAFDRELLLAYAKNQTGIALVIPFLAILIAGITSIWSPWNQVVLWLAGVLIGNGILTYLCQRFEQSDPRTVNARTWEGRFYAAEFLNGVLWATIAFLPVDPADSSPIIFMFSVSIVILAMRTLTASNLPDASLAGTLPITIGLIMRLVLVGDVFHLILAGIVAGAQLFFMILARQFHQTVLAMFGLRAEKDALIGELEQAKAVSDEARRRAEEANLAKSRFLATMSHELRTPLNAILGFSEVLKDELLGKHSVEAYKEYSSDIHKSGEHLLNLINEILDLSRIEAGRFDLKEEAISLPATAEECRHLLKLRANERGMTIRENFEADLPKIWADERSVRQIILNLMSNAIKFTPPGGEIAVTIGWTAGGGQYLSIKDNGPGIPEEEIPTVLSSFGRGSLAHKNAEEGTGLGLPIVVKLMELHGGTFDIRTKLREGTEVIVTFPRARVMKALPPVPEEARPHRAHRSRSAA